MCGFESLFGFERPDTKKKKDFAVIASRFEET